MKKSLALAFTCLAAFTVLGNPLVGLRNPAFLGSLSTLLFDLQPNSGASNLSDALVLDGVTMDLIIACEADDISGTTIACRDMNGTVTLTEGGTGSSPTSAKASVFTDGTTGVRGAASGKAYDAPVAGTVASIGTRDFAVEVVSQATNGYTLAGTTSASASLTGWEMNNTAVLACRSNFIFRDTTTTTNVTATAGNCFSTTHALGFADRSGSFGWYVNGAAAGVAAITSVASSIGGNDPFRFIGRPAVATQTVQDADVYAFRLWACPAATPNCLTTHLQASVATERAAKVFGVRPQVAVGSAVPTTMTRGSTAMADLIDTSTSVRSLYLVSTNAPRVVRRKEVASGEFATGYLAEPASTNLFLQSQTFATSSVCNACSISSDVVGQTAPDGTTTVEGLVANTSPDHSLTQSMNLTVGTYTYSMWMKKGNQDWGGLFVASNGIMFNLNTGVVGNKYNNGGAAMTGAIEAWGNGWFRCSVTYTGTASAVAHYVQLADSDFDGASGSGYQFVGNSVTVNTYIWGAQVELGSVRTSYIVTTTATVTRAADVLTYAGASNVTTAPGTAEVSFLCPSYDVATDNRMMALGAAATSNNAREFSGVATNDRPEFLSRDSAAAAQATITASSGDVTDGEAHALRGTWGTNDFQAWYDGVSTGTDVSGTAPASTTTIFVGSGVSSTLQPACLISRVRSWSSRVAP